MSAALLQPVALCAAFWTALFLYARRARSPQPLRFACALALGAALAHAGWLLLHAPVVWPAIRARPGLLIDPSLGFCVLFAPLGPLLLERSAAAFASLPLALAVARIGCLAAGCCLGTPTGAPWAVAGLHPTALYEIAGLLALHGVVSRAKARFSVPLVLGGIGALRLLIDPLRVTPPLGAPIVPPAVIAAAWLGLAAVLAWRRGGSALHWSRRLLGKRSAKARGARRLLVEDDAAHALLMRETQAQFRACEGLELPEIRGCLHAWRAGLRHGNGLQMSDSIRVIHMAVIAIALLVFGLWDTPAHADEPPPEAVLAVLPFLDFPEPNRIIVDLAPEGSAKPLRLMLDTGASHSVITPVTARELGVQVRRTKQDPYRRPTRLGRDLLFFVDVRSSDTGSKTGWEYGLLGGNFLTEYVVELDFPGRRVRFLDPKRFAVPMAGAGSDEAVVPLRVVGQRPGVEVRMNREKFVVMLDTGVPWPAVLSGKLARTAAVASEKIDGLEAGTAYGPMEVELGAAAKLGIGPFEFADVPLLVAPKGVYNAGFAGDSALGYDLLSQFVLRLDYANQRMWMRRDSAAKLTFFGADVAVFRENGLLLIPHRDHFLAYLVRPDSAGARRGLRSGDWIEGMISAEAIAKTLRDGQELTVIRHADGVGVDTVLEAVETPAAVSAPPQDP